MELYELVHKVAGLKALRDDERYPSLNNEMFAFRGETTFLALSLENGLPFESVKDYYEKELQKLENEVKDSARV